MTQYVLDGKVKVTEHVTDGIENAGCAFLEVGRFFFSGGLWLVNVTDIYRPTSTNMT